MLTVFAWGRVPVFLIAFLWAHRFYRRKITAAAVLPLLGLLITTAGDLCGNWFRACFVFGAAHLCWFAFLIHRGRFSWQTAGLLTLFMLPLLGTVVLPAVDDAHELAFVWYAFCTVISVAAAVGARRSPGGGFYVAGTAALMLSDVCIGLHLAGVQDRKLDALGGDVARRGQHLRQGVGLAHDQAGDAMRLLFRDPAVNHVAVLVGHL